MEIVKNKQRYFLAVLLLLCSALNIKAEVLTGSCGDNVTYTLDTSTGLLKIDGTGPMADYSYSSPSPWYSKESYIRNCVISDGVTTVGDRAFYFCSKLTSVTIPNSVTSIGEDAFCYCNLTSITIPNSVTTIESFAFSDCSGLTSVTIPNSVNKIDSYAFENCSGLTSVTIGSSVTEIGYFAFKGCTNVKTLIYAEGCTKILRTDLTSITSVTIPNSVTEIGYSAFSNYSGLTSVTIPNSVTKIGYSAFEGCSGLTSVTIGSSVTEIGYSAFQGCTNVKTLIYAEGCTKILRTDLTSITSVTIPNSVTEISSSAFSGCSGLTSVTIPSGVTSIGYSSFEGCTSLTDVTCRRRTPPSISYNSFSNYGTLHVLPGSKSAYEKDSYSNYWKNFTIVEDVKPLPLCAEPTIEYSNGKIACKSETVGATCYISYTINSVSGKGSGNVAVEIPQIEISAYAIAEGYDASDTVTKKTFDYVSAGNGGSGDVNGDGKVTMADANAIVNMVLGK